MSSADANRGVKGEGAFYIALVHHPVVDRLGEVVTTAVTNLDVHDLARSARTYDLSGYFVVTPISAQLELVSAIRAHFQEGAGRERVPARAEALALVRPVASIDDAVASIEAETRKPPYIVATSARPPIGVQTTPFEEESRRIPGRGAPTLLLFGTGHGLTRAVLDRADAILDPIRPNTAFNHLSVRAAAAICLDRLFGDRSANGAR